MQIIDLNQSDRYCVFQCGDEAYCLPALSILSVATCEKLAPVPVASPILIGLIHYQREFISVFDLKLIMKTDSTCRSTQAKTMLVVGSETNPWGLVVDSVDGLRKLEVSLQANRAEAGSWSNAKIGSATDNERFIAVLDADNLYQSIVGQLDSYWDNTELLIAGNQN